MKVLIIGLGSIAKKHIEALRKLRNPTIFALRSSRSAEEYLNVKNIYSFDEVEEINFDFVLISSPTAKHYEVIEKAIKLNKPLFIEKPLFSEVGTSEGELVDKISSKGIPTYVGCNLRFLDCLREVKEIIGNERINEINSYSGSFLPDWRPNTDFRKTYSANKELGGGVHIDLIHELDYLYWIFGRPESNISSSSSKSSLNIDAIDYANYLWGYKNFNASIILNYYRRDTKRTLEIVTDKATFLVDLIQNRIHRNEKEIFSSKQTVLDTFEVQMDFFLKNILNSRNTDFNSVEEAYQILQLCLKD